METVTESVFAVRIENPAGSSLGALLSNMRTWMDHQGIHSSDFKSMRQGSGRICCEVSFHQPQQAALFRAAFGG